MSNEQNGLVRTSSAVFPWDCFGVWAAVKTDNGVEFDNRIVPDTLERLGTSIIWCEKGRPEQRAQIERAFGTFDTQFFHDLRGTTKGKPEDKYDRDPEKEAVYTLSQLDDMFRAYIRDIYHHQFHEGLKDKPANMWEEGARRMPPTLPSSVMDVVELLTKIETRTLRRTGIEINGLHYNSGELAQVRDGRTGIRVRIRYNDNDLSHIYVENPDTHEYIKVPSTNLRKTSGLTAGQKRREMAEDNARQAVINNDPRLKHARANLSRMQDAYAPPERHDPAEFGKNNPMERPSPEVEIVEQERATPPSSSDMGSVYSDDQSAEPADGADAKTGTRRKRSSGGGDDHAEWARKRGRR